MLLSHSWLLAAHTWPVLAGVRGKTVVGGESKGDFQESATSGPIFTPQGKCASI